MTEVNVNYIPTHLVSEDGTVVEGHEDEAARISQGVAGVIGDLDPEVKGLFLALIQASLIVPPEATEEAFTEENIAEVLQIIAAAAEEIYRGLLEADCAMLMEAILEIIYMLQWSSVEVREQSRESAFELQLDQADHQRDSAKKELKAAVIDVVTAAVACGLTVACMAVSGYLASRQAEASATAGMQEEQYNKIQTDLADPNQVQNRENLTENARQASVSMRSNQRLSTQYGHNSETSRYTGRQLGESATASGAYFRSEEQTEAKLEQADGTEDSAGASNETAQTDFAKNLATTCDGFLEKFRDALQKYLNSRNESVRYTNLNRV